MLVADEPTGNLDSSSGEEVLNILRASVDELGQTVVMVTHDPRAAARADRVVLLADGRLAGELAQPDPESVAAALMNVTAAPAASGAAPAGQVGRVCSWSRGCSRNRADGRRCAMIRIAWSNLRSAWASECGDDRDDAACPWPSSCGPPSSPSLRRHPAQPGPPNGPVPTSPSPRTNPTIRPLQPMRSHRSPIPMRQTVADVEGVESAQLTQSAFVAVEAGSTSVTGTATNLPQGQVERRQRRPGLG